MYIELRNFLSSLGAFSDEELEALGSKLKVEKIPKNTYLVRETDICNSCFFVLKGCLRQYILKDGLEVTVGFHLENQAVNFFSVNEKAKSAGRFLVSLEESIVLVGRPDRDEKIFEEFPILEKITRKMVEQDFGKTQDDFSKFIASSPEERYLNIQKEQPELLQRVPQHQLASYLGITPESLSRIRKRIQTIKP